MFSWLKNRNRKWVFLLLILASGLVEVGSANEVLQSVSGVFSSFISIFSAISLVILELMSTLIGTELITGEHAMEGIRPIWVIVRNLVNISFMGILIYIAFVNLVPFGEGANSWTIKEKLPKVIIGLVLINFSLLGFRVVIDAANVATQAMFGLVSTIDQSTQNTSISEYLSTTRDENGNICKGGDDCLSQYQRINKIFCGENGIKNPTATNCLIYYDVNPNGKLNISEEKLSEQRRTNRNNLFLSFGIQFMRIEQLPQLSATVGSLSGVLDSTIFSIIMSIAYIIVIVSLFIALIYRLGILWLALVFSPAIVAAWVMGMGNGSDLATKVINNILMPIKIGAAFAIAFLMIATMSKFSIDLGSSIQVGNSFNAFGNTSTNPLRIIWEVMSIMVFWMTAKWAFENTGAEGITNKLFDGAQHAGTWFAKAATIDQQIIPTPGAGNDGKSSISSFLSLPGMIGEKIRQDQYADRQALGRHFNIFDKSNLGKFKEALRDSSTSSADIAKYLKGLTVQQYKDFSQDKASIKILDTKLGTNSIDKLTQSFQSSRNADELGQNIIKIKDTSSTQEIHKALSPTTTPSSENK